MVKPHPEEWMWGRGGGKGEWEKRELGLSCKIRKACFKNKVIAKTEVSQNLSFQMVNHVSL